MSLPCQEDIPYHNMKPIGKRVKKLYPFQRHTRWYKKTHLGRKKYWECTHHLKGLMGISPGNYGLKNPKLELFCREDHRTNAPFSTRSMASLLVDRRVSYDDPHYPMKLLIVPMLVKIIASKYPHDKSQYVLSKSPLIIIEIPFVYIYQNAIRRHQFSCLNCLELTCFSVNYNNSLTWIKAIK